ncbi:hypothetical protein RclHR1_09050006 [Rhizophagus clarus]|uniref:Uncharacterized protein n=1 Tax=Rhizophagus clarus TaxID=94130 RepID=A0A2Z6S371_9GLOM|nr:hypothetical protein RclHR1_09050006 [Rhizophagus clarus]
MEQTHKNIRKDKPSRTKWSESAIKALLSFLLEHKDKLEELKYTHRAISNPGNIQLWKDAENLVDNYKTQLAESKKSSGPPITIQYKEEIEAILDKNGPILNPKSCIDSCEFSLKKDDDLIQENPQVETPYVIPKIGRKHKNKRKNNDANTNLEDQNRKKSKKCGNNLGDILQNWIEQQEVKQIKLDKKRKKKKKKEQEQRLELLHMKQQSDMMLFNILNNLSNSLNSLHTKQNQLN